MQPSYEPPVRDSGAGPVSPAAPLVEVRRGPIVESRHRGHVVAVDGEGKTVGWLGTPGTVTYLRSSAKPFQAIPLIASGAADHFGFTEQEIALACASHSGEPLHTELAHSMLKKIGLGPEALKCGVHEPFSAVATRLLRERGEAPNVLQNNCSGKHAGMLALALHLGAPTETYDSVEHPVQVAVARTIAQFSGTPLAQVAIGVDGCGVPVFGISLRAMALMYARLIKSPAGYDEATRQACRRIVAAMVKYPEIIGGTSDRLDTEIMRAGDGLLISKVGAEGVYTAGILPGGQWSSGLGLALKIEDGDDHRARPTVVIEALRQLGVFSAAALEAVARYARFPIRNRHGDAVGEVRAAFALEGVR